MFIHQFYFLNLCLLTARYLDTESRNTKLLESKIQTQQTNRNPLLTHLAVIAPVKIRNNRPLPSGMADPLAPEKQRDPEQQHDG